MFRRVEIVGTGSHTGHDTRAESGVDDAPTEVATPARSRPNLSGDLDELLDSRPAFRVRTRGYDRLQVDNYVAWAEWEIVTVRREAEHLLAQFGACSAELEISRRLLAETPKSREVGPVSERVGQILRLAAEEATQMIDAAGDEADQLLTEARLEADARLRKAHSIKERAVAAGDEIREQARRDRAEATELLDRARIDADELLRGAQADRDKLAAEAAQMQERADAAAQRLAAVQAELADLRRQRDEARASLRRLTDQIGEMLQAVGSGELATELATATGRAGSGAVPTAS
jgi:cell division septum initiation protein DivIVA